MMINGKSISEFGLIEQPGHSHPTPTFSRKTMKIPNVPGEYYFGSEIGVRENQTPVAVLKATRNISHTQIKNLLNELVDQYGHPKPVELSYEYDYSKYMTVYLDGSIDPSWSHSFGQMQFNLVAFDPFLYNKHLANEITWGSEEITFEYNYLLGHEGSTGMVELTNPDEVNLYVEGLAVKPIIEISGSADNLTITNGDQVINFPNFTDTEWIIDCSEYEVYRNGEQDYDAIRLRDFWLYQGNNEVKINGSNINIAIRIKYRDRYL